jgi:hypothetical protein
MKNNRSGFMIISALGLSAVLMIGVFTAIAMQKSVDDETRQNAARHARYIAEDILKTQVAIKTQFTTQITDIATFINAIKDPNTGLKVPILGTDCGNNVPCNLSVLSMSPATISSSTTQVTLVVGVSAAESDKVKIKFEPLSVILKIPSQAQIDNRTAQSLGSYSCPASTPLFKGLKKVGNAISPDCGTISPSSVVAVNSTVSGVLDVTCSIPQGKWMTFIKSDLSPECVDFVDDARLPSSLDICSADDEYPEGYRLDGKFNVVAKTCVKKGNPYDFVPEANN